MRSWKSFSFFMPNADPSIVRLQKAVFEALNEPLVQVRDTCSHGEFMTRTIRASVRDCGAVVFFDLDCIPLKAGVVEKAVRIAIENQMVIGCAQQANHIEVLKFLQRRHKWPVLVRKFDSARIKLCSIMGIDPYHFENPLVYAGPCFLVVPTRAYDLVGRPTLDRTARCDVAGELTVACREQGVRVKCLQPTYCHLPKYKLGNTVKFGLGTVYGHCIFHAFETTYQGNGKSASLFRKYCDTVLSQNTKEMDLVQGK